MYKRVLSEYLGTMDAQVLLKNLDNTNLRFSPVPELLLDIHKPLLVDAEVEYTWDHDDGSHPTSKHFVRLVFAIDEE